jgi:hypothetical protein
MIYALTPSEYQALYRRSEVPNMWIRAGMVGPWVHLINMLNKQITCNTLEKHIVAIHGIN